MGKKLLIGILLGTYSVMNAQTSEPLFKGFVNDWQLTNKFSLNKDKPVPIKTVAAQTAATPLATYTLPEGYLFSGLATDYQSLDGMAALGGAQALAQWKSISLGAVQSVAWNFNGEIKNETNPTVTLPEGLYAFPVLTATGTNNATSFYQMGIAGKNNVLKLGGDNTWKMSAFLSKSFGLGNYDLSKGSGSVKDSLLDYAGEELAIGKFVGAGNSFEKPAGRMVFDKVYVHCLNLEVKANQSLTINIYEEINNQVGNLIATSTAKASDIVHVMTQGNSKFYTVTFSFDPISVTTAFFVEFTGYVYTATGMFLQYENHPVKNYAYMVYEGGRVPLTEMYEQAPKTSFLFGLNGSFPDNTAIAAVSSPSEQVQVTYQADQVILTYPAEATAVSIYTVAGQAIAEYPLDKSGTFTLPTTQLSKGIYILKFNKIHTAVKIFL